MGRFLEIFVGVAYDEARRIMSAFGLVGTITSDHIVSDAGSSFRGIGGILYQAAVLCGLKEDVRLAAYCGSEMKREVLGTIASWKSLRRRGLRFVPGPGNQVFLSYSGRRAERREVLESVVPPLDADRVLADLDPGRLDMLLMVFNSGFDASLETWRRIVDQSPCPVWLDIHSLALSKRLRKTRTYVSIPEWRQWVKGVDYLQANRQELASLLGHPERWPDDLEIADFSREANDIGIEAVFLTLGKGGVMVLAAGQTELIQAPRVDEVVDTTGCGDVFCAATMSRLAGGASLFEAAYFGVNMATKAVGLAGIRETYELAAGTRLRKRADR
jgi:sugar/nucleoside kinase (ribokinase family)